MRLSDINGLKFPDEYVIKFFFKEGLHKNGAKVLELGCANGNNARLFFEFGWDVTGVDFDEGSVSSANSFFGALKTAEGFTSNYSFVCSDMVEFVLKDTSTYDAIILPNSLCYLTNAQIDTFFGAIKQNGLLKKNGKLFIRTRLLSDYRYARGDEIGKNSFMLTEKETGEAGCVNTFFSDSGLVLKLKEFFSFKDYVSLNVLFENPQNGRTVSNADVVFWATIEG